MGTVHGVAAIANAMLSPRCKSTSDAQPRRAKLKVGLESAPDSAMRKFTIELPDDVFGALRLSPNEVAHDVRLAAALSWFQRGKLSQGRAAEVAGVSREEFLDALAAHKIDAVDVDLDELDRELRGG